MRPRVVRQVVLGATLTLLAACAGPAREPWVETFAEPGDWHLSSDATAEVAVTEGRLLIHVSEPGQVAWTSAGRTFGDLRLTVTASQVSGPLDNEYGVLLRMEDDERFYAFSISGDGYVRAALYEEDTWTVLGPDWQRSDAVHQGMATNLLEVEAQGPAFTFRVNGTEVLRIEDRTYARGDVGLYAGAFNTPDVVIAFDDLNVQPLP